MTHHEHPPTGLDAWAYQTIGDLREAVAAGSVAKNEFQLYGLDWSQIEREPDDAIVRDVFARHGAIVEPDRLDSDEGGVIKTPM